MPISAENQERGKASFAVRWHPPRMPTASRGCQPPQQAMASLPQHDGRSAMPLIHVSVIKDVFSKEQKRQIISKLTDAMVAIEGEAMRGVTWCVVEEVESGDWGIGGNALTTADVHALARGKAA